LDWEWDPRKRALNLRKHGIAFEDAVELFEHPRLEGPDDRRDYGEDRWIAFGEMRGHVIAVVFTWRGETRRIISARKATRLERETYYQTLHAGER
jgi:uncharacterized protein